MSAGLRWMRQGTVDFVVSNVIFVGIYEGQEVVTISMVFGPWFWILSRRPKASMRAAWHQTVRSKDNRDRSRKCRSFASDVEILVQELGR